MNREFFNAETDNTRESIINRLEGVIASKVVEKEGKVEEIHVLVDKGRSPKQVSRNVQSTFAAWFGEELDHRKISVAQLDGFKTKKNSVGRISFEKITSSSEPDGRVTLGVTLNYDDIQGIGEHSGFVGKKGRLKLAGEATLIALRDMFDLQFGLTLEDVQKQTIANEEVVNSAILLTRDTEETLLIGSAYVKHSDLEATVKATLDAVNRRLPHIL